MEYSFTPKFKLNQIVYLRAPESEAHIVVDICFSVSPKEITYGLLSPMGEIIYLPKYALSLQKTIS